MAIRPVEEARLRPPERAELIGLGVLLLSVLAMVAVGAGWVTGPLATVLLGAIMVGLATMVVVAFTGTPESRRKLAPYGLLQPGVLWLALFFLAPLWVLFVTSLSEQPERFSIETEFTGTLDNYSRAFTDFGPQFGRAFLYAAIATILTLLIGYPMAYFIATRGGRWKTLLLGLVVVPFFTSYLIRTLAWSTILADEGPVVTTIERLGLDGLLDTLGIMENGRLLQTPGAVIGGLTYNFLPFMILPIFVSLEKIEPRLVDAAKDLYSSGSRAFWKIVFPLSLPGVFAGSLLTFIPMAGDFINAEFLGSPRTTMIGNSIQDQFLNQNNYPLAAAMSFVLMVVITIAVLVYTRLLGTEDLA